MKERKFKLTNWTDYTGMVGTIPVKNSIATVTEEHQLRVLDRQKILGDFKFEEIFDEPQQQAVNIAKHDVEQRSGNVGENTPNIIAPKKTGRPRNSDRR